MAIKRREMEKLPPLAQIFEMAAEIIDARLDLEVMNAMRGINDPIDPLPWWVVEVMKTFKKYPRDDKDKSL